MKLEFWIVLGGLVAVVCYIILFSYILHYITNDKFIIFLNAVLIFTSTIFLVGGALYIIETEINRHRRKICSKRVKHINWLVQLGLIETITIIHRKVKDDIYWFT